MPSHRALTAYSNEQGAFQWGRQARRRGQSTVEYALVLVAFLAMLSGAGAMWRMLESGMPVQHALQSASHHVASVAPGAFSDVFMY